MKHQTNAMKTRLLLLFCYLIFGYVAPLFASQSAVVLTYHRIGEDDVPSTNVRIEQFEQQLDYLQQNDFTVWPLLKILQVLEQGETLPPRTVAITLDDAYYSIYAEAFPRLQKRGYPFTVFVSTEAVDKGYRRYMNWDHLREMKRAGVTIANHGTSHPYMVRRLQGENDSAYHQRLKGEIQQAQQRLVEELGDAPMLFAYPYGEFSEEVKGVVGELGYIAVAQYSGAIDAHSDRLALPRFPINEHYSNISDVALKLKSRPLRVVEQSPVDPLWPGIEAPRLEMRLGEKVEGIGELACYASGQGRMEIEWLDRKQRRFVIQATKPLSEGRHRYTCTAPDKTRRYQWFSQLWIVNPPESAQSDHTE